MRALLSVTDKTGLAAFALGLEKLGFELVSTGGTAEALRQAGLRVTPVEDLTRFPEAFDGRVKTLHPNVHAGILADRRKPEHQAQLEALAVRPFDLVCVNLYAFEATVRRSRDHEEGVESIDIGGPTLIRAAAKNHANVTVVVDPADYHDVLDALGKGTVEGLRQALAAKAFRLTAFYDTLVSRWLAQEAGEGDLRELFSRGFRRRLALRYGENPHQQAALYVDPLYAGGIANAEQLWGKELSYNNLLDADAAWGLVIDLAPQSCAIIKHGNPCGAASLSDGASSYRAARETDRVSAFGGIAAFHGHVDVQEAEAMTEKGNFLEVVIAESFTEAALEQFRERSGWGQDVRLLACGQPQRQESVAVRSISGGALVQAPDFHPEGDWTVVTRRKPEAKELESLRFAWQVVPHVKSNAIVVAGPDRLFGIGAGQMNRVQSVRLALEQAGDQARGAVLASDAFFPFPDSVEAAAAAGIGAVVQPGGSKKDPEVVQRADELGLAMVFTGARHFRH